MKVINVCGFDLQIEKDNYMYKIPNDNELHILPDKCFYEDNFQGLLRVIIPPKEVTKVLNRLQTTEINTNTIKEILIERDKHLIIDPRPLSGKKIKKEIRDNLKNKPLAGRKIKKEVRNKLLKKRNNNLKEA